VTQVYGALEDKPYESHYLYVDTIIDHPVEKVWPHALDIGRWMTAHRLETLSGEKCRVGHFERVFPRSIGQDVPLPHYHLYGIAKIIPLKYIALEVMPENGGSYGVKKEWMSFDGILFSDIGDRTHVVFLMVDAALGNIDAEYSQRRAKEVEDARAMINGYFENLKQLAGNAA
jgi:hypothetical protein